MTYIRPVIIDLGSIADNTFVGSKANNLADPDLLLESSATPAPGV